MANFNYPATELYRLRANGTQPDEDFYRVKVTGNGETRWFNITPRRAGRVCRNSR